MGPADAADVIMVDWFDPDMIESRRPLSSAMLSTQQVIEDFYPSSY